MLVFNGKSFFIDLFGNKNIKDDQNGYIEDF